MRHHNTHHDHQHRHGHGDRNRGEHRFAHGPMNGEGPHRGGGRHRRGGDDKDAPLGEAPYGGEYRGRRRQRVFDHGDLRFVLLGMIAARPAHGYDLIKALEERMGGGYSPSPGVIYPTLTMLEEQGYAALSAEDGKKLYRATAEGEAFLKANQATIDAIQARIDGVARERAMVPDPRIIRAIENLKTALRLRIASGPISDERVRAISAAIDAAAAEAEQI